MFNTTPYFTPSPLLANLEDSVRQTYRRLVANNRHIDNMSPQSFAQHDSSFFLFIAKEREYLEAKIATQQRYVDAYSVAETAQDLLGKIGIDFDPEETSYDPCRDNVQYSLATLFQSLISYAEEAVESEKVAREEYYSLEAPY